MENLIKKIEKMLLTIHGWCNIEKATKFVEVITNTKPDLLVEIGVFGGSSLLTQAMTLKENNKGIIYGIDPWATDAALEHMINEENKSWWGTLNLDDIYNHCLQKVNEYDLNNYVRLIRNKSQNVVDQFHDESIDILHIDGNHSEELSYKDAELYLPKVKKNGYIFFDDIFWTEDGVNVTTRKAILYLLNNCDKVDNVKDCMILQKMR